MNLCRGVAAWRDRPLEITMKQHPNQGVIDDRDGDAFVEDTMKNREAAVRMARDAAARGDSLAGMLSELERSAAPFFLGIDEDPDDSDMDVFP